MSAERPSREQLRAFLLGRVTAEEQERIAAYLDSHPEVTAELAALDGPGDDLVAELRGEAPSDTFTREPAFWRGLSRAKSAPLDPPPPAAPDPYAGRTLGPYRVLRRLSRRGPGAVYVARHTDSGRPVALKVLAPDHAGDPEAVRRFGRERAWAAGLDHPHVVRG